MKKIIAFLLGTAVFLTTACKPEPDGPLTCGWQPIQHRKNRRPGLDEPGP